MTFLNKTAGIKQFQIIRFINENCDDEHIMSKISIVLRRDKIEAPYYMITKISISTCLDRPENGLIHAMDILNHHRRHNLSEDAYNEIKSLILSNNHESEQITITETDNQIKMTLISRNDEENKNLFESYGNLFDKIDSLID